MNDKKIMNEKERMKSTFCSCTCTNEMTKKKKMNAYFFREAKSYLYA